MAVLLRAMDENKKCSKCGQVKPLEDFAKHAGKHDGLQSWCRECKKSRDAEYYQENKDKYLQYNRDQYARYRKKLNELKSLPCADCGGTFPPYVMDFDHLEDAIKKFNVGVTKKYNWEETLREIAKCELVCANCHRIRTHERRSTSLSSSQVQDAVLSRR
jgi:hypothetical protein